MHAQSIRKAAAVPARSAGWIVSPLFDVLFFANLFWLLALVPGYVSSEGTPYIEFWQVHFIASPHRWLTLLLVASDPDRRAGRSRLFVAIAGVIAVVLAGVQWATGSLLALGLAYYCWNSWHFAAQHSGILRLYALKSGSTHRWVETYALRAFVLYAGLRLMPGFDRLLEPVGLNPQAVDLAVLAIPVVMLVGEWRGRPASRVPKMLYLTSVCALYSSLILAAHTQQKTLILGLVAAATVFHSTEYFAFVSNYAWKRQRSGSPSLFQRMARHWLLVLAWFLVACGLIFSTADRLFVAGFYAVNLWASFSHFAYDGLIWKLRKPSTARLLDAAPTPAPQTA